MLALYPNQLRADLRRIYHLSLDDAGTGYSWRDLAAMVAYLPTDSAVLRAEGSGWSETEMLLAQIADNTYKAWWQRIDHGKPDAPGLMEVVPPNRRAQVARQRAVPLEEKKRLVAEAYGYDEEVLDG